VLVPTNTKLTHVFGSKVLVLVLVCYKLTLTPPSKHGQWDQGNEGFVFSTNDFIWEVTIGDTSIRTHLWMLWFIVWKLTQPMLQRFRTKANRKWHWEDKRADSIQAWTRRNCVFLLLSFAYCYAAPFSFFVSLLKYTQFTQ
jgi:hypothetical protein